MKKRFLLYCVMLAVTLTVFGQEKDNISPDETLKYINGKLEGFAQLRNERGLLVVEFFKKGKVNRVDRVPIQQLNPDNVEYIADEKAIIIRCIVDNCIDRKIEIPKSRGQFSRISFVGEFDAKTQVGLVKAFEHLINMFRDRNYKNNTPFE